MRDDYYWLLTLQLMLNPWQAPEVPKEPTLEELEKVSEG
jgi:hypothetical protein